MKLKLYFNLFLYRFLALVIAIAETIVPALKNLPKSLDPTLGEIRVISDYGYASRVLPIGGGILLAGYEAEDKIETAISTDEGKTWHNKTVAASEDTLNCANINFYMDGDTIYLAYRATGTISDGSFYSSLRVNKSTDGGLSWSEHSVVAENIEDDGSYKGLWEPFLYKINGKLTCLYANDSITKNDSYQNIESLTYNGETWSERKIVSDGKKHNSRDGMPVLCRLSNGKYILAIESTKYRTNYPFIIQLLVSEDGSTWSEPKDVYIPKTKGSKAGAPGICETADGRIAVTFQTDEDKTIKGDAQSVSKIITAKTKCIKLLSPAAFSPASCVFPKEYDNYSVWGGISSDGERIYYSAGTEKGAIINVLSAATELEKSGKNY